MVDIINWPVKLLRPASAIVAPVPFSRSGGRSLGGIERTTRTDRGYWRISLTDVTLRSPAMRRTWNAIRSQLAGKAGLIAVPAWSFDSAPYASGQRERTALVSHNDQTTFEDGSLYRQGAIDIEMASYAPLGATVANIRLINASSASGIRFSFQHALYETGRVLSQPDEDIYQVQLSTAIRSPVPSGSKLEADMPTCLCHLADDRGMDVGLSNVEIDSASLNFVEAVDFWNDLALGTIE